MLFASAILREISLVRHCADDVIGCHENLTTRRLVVKPDMEIALDSLIEVVQ